MSTIIIIRKPPAYSLVVVPAEDQGFLIQDAEGNTIATALDEDQANAYADMITRGE